MIVRAMLAAAIAGAHPSVPAGFICTATDGQSKRLNIDLRKRRYDDGTGWRKIAEISDVAITLAGENPDLMDTPLGPIINTLKLDRETLTLTEQTSTPARGMNKTVAYQCVQGGLIDFSAGRRF